jgi:hypothetical protein
VVDRGEDALMLPLAVDLPLSVDALDAAVVVALVCRSLLCRELRSTRLDGSL